MVRGAEIDSDEPSARGRCRVGRLVRALCGCMLVLLLTWPAAVVAGELHIDRLVGAEPEGNPSPEALEALDWEAQPGRAAIDRGTRWWRVQVQPPQPPDQRWVLALREVFDGRLVVYRPPHYRPEPLEVFDRDAPVIGSRHRLAVELEAGSLEQPVYLEVVEARWFAGSRSGSGRCRPRRTWRRTAAGCGSRPRCWRPACCWGWSARYLP